jgi:hypothetical protein
VFVDDHEGNVDKDNGSEAGQVWDSAKEKTTTLERAGPRGSPSR